MSRTTFEWDTYKVLPHKDVLDCSLYGADGSVIRLDLEHVPCGMPLQQRDIEDNWCLWCDADHQTINKAAKARAKAEWK